MIQTIFIEILSAVLVFASSQEENVILQLLYWCWWVLRRDILRTWRWKGQIGHFKETSLNFGCYPGTGNLGSDCKPASRQKYFTRGPCQFFFFFFLRTSDKCVLNLHIFLFFIFVWAYLTCFTPILLPFILNWNEKWNV